MSVSTKIFVLWCLVTTVFNIGPTCANVYVKDNARHKFIAFIGANIQHTDDNGQLQVVREVVGIGAVIGDKYILTSKQYTKWEGQLNIEFFVLVGTHDFDNGGTQLEITQTSQIPQNNLLGSHTYVLLTVAERLTSIKGVSKITLESSFVQHGLTIEMVGIFERESVKLATSNETILANVECKKLLDVKPKDKRYERLGSHLCLETTNWERVDCKSHIGTLIFHHVNGIDYLIGMKSETHPSCSRIPYLIQFQRVSHLVSSL